MNKWIYKSRYKILLLGGCLINFIVFLSFNYHDTSSLAAWSLNIWDLIFGEQNLGDFYSYTQLNLRGAGHANCSGNYLWLLPLSIWNFPLWLICVATDTLYIANPIILYWSKMFFLMMLFVCTIAIFRLCFYFTKDNEKSIIACILLLFSPEVLMSVDYAGQDEIVYMCVLAWAMYFFINKKYKITYLLLVVAVTICPIMILPALVFVLVKQKSILCICRDIIGMLLPLLAFEIFYSKDTIYQTVKQQHSLKELGVEMLTDVTVGLSKGDISVALVLLIIIFYLAYTLKYQEGEEKSVLLLLSSTMVVICFFMSSNFYRMFLYIPFLAVLIMTGVEKLNASVFLLTVVSWCRSCYSLTMEYPYNMNLTFLTNRTWVERLKVNGINFESAGLGKYFLEGDWIPLLNTITATCAYTCIGILLFINLSLLKSAKSTTIVSNEKYKFELSYDISLYIYCSCAPIMLLACLKLLF